MNNNAVHAAERVKSVVDVHLLLKDGDKILLGQRINTGFGDGAFHPPAGHLEADESVVAALVREAKEEIGITIDSADVELAHVLHNSSSGGRVAFFFEVERWEGEPSNMEVDKCAGWEWFSRSDLPEEMIPYVKHALHSVDNREKFSLYGW